jgi:hypothetical protein
MGIIWIEALLKETYNFYIFKQQCTLQKKIPKELKNVVPWKPLDAIKNGVFYCW